MSKHKSNPTMSIDFDTGIDMIIPAKQEAYSNDGFSGAKRKDEKSSISVFKQTLLQRIENDLKSTPQFPTNNEVFIFIIQYFLSEKEYKIRDVDNISKTVLDALKEKFYNDDGQVRTLLVTKKMEKRVQQNFAYIAIKELKNDNDIEVLKTSGVERSVTMYQELKSQGII